MSRKTKLYRLIDHSTTPSSYFTICAYSKKNVAEILNKPYSAISQNITDVTDEQAGNLAHLKHGEIERDPEHKAPKGMSMRDYDRISSLGFLKAAILALENSTPPNNEMRDRMYAIVKDIKELKADISDYIEDEFNGR